MKYDNLTWQDTDGLYRAWSFNEGQNRYYFDDYGDESFMEVWSDLYTRSDGGEEQESQESLFEGKLVEL